VHDALKRRCLYQWLEYPGFDKELAIVRARVPEASAQLAAQVTALAQELRTQDLYKVPGVSETIDWASALVALGHDRVDAQGVGETLGVVLKAREDVDAMRGARVNELLAKAAARVTGGA
jgi:MoxR-like ATPase